jgi:flagellar biosynthesis protein FlhB
MSDQDETSKTEEATPERARKAREQGQFPRSRDAGAVASSAAVLLTVMALGPVMVQRMHEFALRCFGHASTSLGVGLRQLVVELGMTVAVLALPPALAAAIASTAMGLLQAGFHPIMELASPDLNRLDPMPKLANMFSLKTGAMGLLMSFAHVLVVGAVTYWVLSDEFGNLVSLGRTELSAGMLVVLRVCLKLSVSAVGALAALSALDYGYNRYKHFRSIRMTRQEVKDEMQQQEGDPKVKMRQRQRAREIVRRGIAQEVKRATVVIANPTHVSVALRYRPEEGIPIVAAKGYDEVALYIRQLARQHRVPIIENRPLARALAEKVRVGRTIPVDLYAAVAEVLAMVYRLQNRLPRRRS